MWNPGTRKTRERTFIAAFHRSSRFLLKFVSSRITISIHFMKNCVDKLRLISCFALSFPFSLFRKSSPIRIFGILNCHWIVNLLVLFRKVWQQVSHLSRSSAMLNKITKKNALRLRRKKMLVFMHTKKTGTSSIFLMLFDYRI